MIHSIAIVTSVDQFDFYKKTLLYLLGLIGSSPLKHTLNEIRNDHCVWYFYSMNEIRNEYKMRGMSFDRLMIMESDLTEADVKTVLETIGLYSKEILHV